MKLIDGKAIAAEVRSEVKLRAAAFEAASGKKPGLAVVLIGSDPASSVYVRNKINACEEAGIRSFCYRLPEDTAEEEAEELIGRLAASADVHGILVQLPLPAHLKEEKLLAKIPVSKDVDGFSAENIGRLARGERAAVACTSRWRFSF